MPGPLENKRVILGVTGSIACYKALDLASKMVQAGALVDTVMSYGATQFVTPLAFRSITHREVVTELFDPDSTYSIEHIELAQRADLVVIAPATAHCIAKLAAGLADDSLTTTVLAATAPLLVAPAMDGGMYSNAATQARPASVMVVSITVILAAAATATTNRPAARRPGSRSRAARPRSIVTSPSLARSIARPLWLIPAPA